MFVRVCSQLLTLDMHCIVAPSFARWVWLGGFLLLIELRMSVWRLPLFGMRRAPGGASRLDTGFLHFFDYKLAVDRGRLPLGVRVNG